jgi:hypothetical protein
VVGAAAVTDLEGDVEDTLLSAVVTHLADSPAVRDGTDFLQGAKEKRVLGIDRRSGHCSRNRAHTKKKWDRIDADRFISSGAGDNKLPAWSKPSEKRRHGFTVCAGSEDQQGAAKGLKSGNRVLSIAVNVMMCSKLFGEIFLFWSASPLAWAIIISA